MSEEKDDVVDLAARFKKFLRRDGRANAQGLGQDDFDQKSLSRGMRVEREHTTDDDIARRIAMDHLTEMPDYYDRLAKMEGEG